MKLWVPTGILLKEIVSMNTLGWYSLDMTSSIKTPLPGSTRAKKVLVVSYVKTPCVCIL